MIPDLVAEGLASGWNVRDGPGLGNDLAVEADVAIVGTGAGGGTAAEILAKAGLKVVLIEEGPLSSSADFDMREARAYPDLYQESAGRKTLDKGINILQGRCVGGSTTVNWTSSFRTPSPTLAHWRSRLGLQGLEPEALAPWFQTMERRLAITDWDAAPNENNDVLARGAAKLGIPTARIRRNVKGCWNLGYCGTGCPTNAKQSMLVTTIPSALARGAMLLTRTRAQRFVIRDDRVQSLECVALDATGLRPGPHRITLRARQYILAAGAVGSPALLLRSAAPDPHSRLGKRTFLHPTCICAAVMPGPIDGHAGAPQTVYSDHFLGTDPIDGPLGYKLEVPPLHPLLAATTLAGHGAVHASHMTNLAHTQVIIALLRDGFHPDSIGGSVTLNGDGSPVLDYAIGDVVWEGMRRAYLSMAEIQFAAGAKSVLPVHEAAVPYRTWATAKAAIANLPMRVLIARVVSAHVMGGCAMGTDPKTSVIRADGRHHQVENLAVLDGSVFPTSIGANPQLSIYGLVARNASLLASALTNRPAPTIA